MSDIDESSRVPPPIDPPPVHAAPESTSAEQRQWAMFAHLSALLGAALTAGWGCFVGPLVIWLVKKDTMPLVDDQAKEALNFNITVVGAGLALVLLTVVTFGIGLVIAIPVGLVLGVAWLVLTIVAGIKANEGVVYRYPFTLRLIK